MPELYDTIRLFLPQGRRGLQLESLRRVLRPVYTHGSTPELMGLAQALLASQAPQGVVCGLEALARADPKQVLRHDDDLDTLSSRGEQLVRKGPEVSALPAAWPSVPEHLRGDGLLLAALTPCPEARALVRNELIGGTSWSPLAGLLYHWQARSLEHGGAASRQQVEVALLEALECWEHHQSKSVLTAAAIHAPAAGVAFLERLDDRESPVVAALRRHVRQAGEDDVRQKLVRLLGVRGLADSAIDGLESLRGSQLDGVLSRDGALLASPVRMRRLSRSRLGVRLAGRLSGRVPVPVPTARSLPRVLSHCLRNPEQLARKLGCLARHPDQLAGILATAELNRLQVSEPARQEILDELATTSPVPSIARLADSARSNPSVTAAFRALPAFVKSLEKDPPWRCAIQALGPAEFAPDALAHVLRTALVSGSKRARVAALEVIDRRRLVPAFERELIDLVALPPGGGSIGIASRALALLPKGPTGRSARTIVRSLASIHPELQVRALEAATCPTATPAVRTGCALVDEDLLERLARGADRRVRAGALKALEHRSQVRARRVVEGLLADGNLDHRLSGLDGVRVTADPDLRPSVLRMLEREAEQAVMIEGREVLRFLESRGRARARLAGQEVTS